MQSHKENKRHLKISNMDGWNFSLKNLSMHEQSEEQK